MQDRLTGSVWELLGLELAGENRTPSATPRAQPAAPTALARSPATPLPSSPAVPAPIDAPAVTFEPPVGAPRRAASFFEFHITRDPAGMWRWTLLTANGHALARSALGYVREFECEEDMRRILLADASTPVIRY